MTSEVAKAIHSYNFIRKDLGEGLNYGVDADLYNRSMAAIGSDLTADKTVTAKKFCDDFYKAYHKTGD